MCLKRTHNLFPPFPLANLTHHLQMAFSPLCSLFKYSEVKYGANNREVVCSIPVWAFHFREVLMMLAGSFQLRTLSVILCKISDSLPKIYWAFVLSKL